MVLLRMLKRIVEGEQDERKTKKYFAAADESYP